MVRLLKNNPARTAPTSNRWPQLSTIAAFLAGVDERPYLGSLVNYAVNTNDVSSNRRVLFFQLASLKVLCLFPIHDFRI